MRWMPRGWMLVGLLLMVMTSAGAAQVTTTQVTDTVYHADGTAATGTVLISWPAFTTGSGQSIASGSTSAVIGAGGALSVSLIPNAGSTPMGSYYTAVFHLDDGSVSREYWVVPVSAGAVKISAIESTVLPTSVAMQTVSKSYVDTAIAAALTGHPEDTSPYVLKSGDTMTGPLVLPADPVSATQAADKNYVDESVAAIGGGLGQKVSTSPSASQTVTQPTATELDVNRLNGVEYASQYVSGRGSNGIANAAASPDCVGGCEINVQPDYPTDEPFAASSLTSQSHVQDLRGGRQVDSYLNPLDVVGHGLSTAQAIDSVSTQSEASIFQQTGNQIPGSIALSITQEGLAGGSNMFPEQINPTEPYFKMGYSALSIKGVYNTQGQHGLVPQEIDCFGVGDCLMGSRFLYASGGARDSADEGAHPFDLSTQEDTRVFEGGCVSGCTTGSTSVMLRQDAGGGTQGDGRFLIDLNTAKTITSASTGGSIVGGSTGVQHATAQFSGTSFPVSVFLSLGQVVPSQSNNLAPGTVTFAIATTGVPSGYATSTAAIGGSSGLACVVDQTSGYAPQNYEMAPYTVVDGTHLRMTLNKPHQILATLAFGGLCGYGLEQTVDTTNGIRQVFPVVGSYSATGLYYSGLATPVVGQMNETAGYLNVTGSIVSLTRAGGVVSVSATGLAADVNGLTVTIAGVADSSFNGNYAVTTTGPGTFTYAQSGANSSSSGGTASVLTGGFALYPMAEVLSVYDTATNSVDGQMTLAPNNVPWAVNDPVEEPHYFQEYVAADVEAVGQFVPRPTTPPRAGIQYQHNTGPGLIGWSIANGSPTSNYLGYGGTHGAPFTAYEATGVWNRTMNLNAGEQAAFAIHCNLHGCGNWNSGYDLFELDSSVGVDTISYSPLTSTMSLNFRGTPYSFSPLAFTAQTINVGTLNATTVHGSINAASITSGTLPASVLPVFGASGSVHAQGAVPDPGATAGSARFLREDGTWVVPSGGGGGGGSGSVTITGGTVDGAVIGGTTPAAVTATALNGLPVGEYISAPRAPLATWMEGLHNAANQTARVLLPGDSFGICGIYNCTDGVTNQSNLWTEQLRINLQAQYGSHGTGVVPAMLVIGSNVINSAAWSTSGSYSVVGTLGPTIPSVNGTLIHLSSGASMTFNDSRHIPFDHFSVYYATPTTSSSLALVADGGTSIGTASSSSATASGASAGGLTAYRFDSSAMSLATHTVTATCTGDCYLWAGDGTAGTAGVSVDNVSIGSCPAECFGLAPATQLAFTDLIPGGDQGVIVMQQTNEPGQGYSTTSFASAMTAITTHEQGLSSTNPASVMFAVPPVGAIASSTMASFTAVQVSLARTLNVAFANIQDRWGTAYSSANGLWDQSSVCPGCHPNDKGARDEYSEIWAAFVDSVPFAPSSSGAPGTIAGLVAAGSNVTITGAGTSASPYTIAATGGGSGGGCSANCTFTGATALSSGSTAIALSATSTSSTGTAITMTGTAAGVHTWATQTDQNGNFLVGDFTAGNYPFAIHYTAAPNGSVSVGNGIAYAWSSGVSPSNTTPDTALSRLGAGSVGIGNGTPGDTSGALTLGNLNVVSTAASGAIPMGIYDANLGTGSIIGFGTGKTPTAHNSVFNAWYNAVAPYGSFESYGGGDPIQLKGSQIWLNGGPVAIGNSSATGAVAAPSLPGLLNVGTSNQFNVDTNGNVTANLYKGPATAPSGSCSAVGWAFSQDGHATFCNGSTWVTKI